MRFAEFINDVVAKRKLPTSAQVITPRVVIKVINIFFKSDKSNLCQADIEGAELKILPDMIMTGALQHIDNLHMEWHGEASYRSVRDTLGPAMICLMARYTSTKSLSSPNLIFPSTWGEKLK